LPATCYYLSAIALTRAELMGEINCRRLTSKKALAADAKERNAELAEVEAEQQKRHADLQKAARGAQGTVCSSCPDKVNSSTQGNRQPAAERKTTDRT
jgi:hypothetical protein